MAKKNYEELASAVLQLVGGKDNISIFTHCVTRLRFTVKDKAKVDVEGLKAVSGVVGTQFPGVVSLFIIEL